jgi:hypothetical protein
LDQNQNKWNKSPELEMKVKGTEMENVGNVGMETENVGKSMETESRKIVGMSEDLGKNGSKA